MTSMEERKAELLARLDKLRSDIEADRYWTFKVDEIRDLMVEQRAEMDRITAELRDAAQPGAGGHRWYTPPGYTASLCAACNTVISTIALDKATDAVPTCTGSVTACKGRTAGYGHTLTVVRGSRTSDGRYTAVECCIDACDWRSDSSAESSSVEPARAGGR